MGAKVYIASSLENAAAVRRLRDLLVWQGHTVTYDWTEHGSVQSEGPERIAAVAAAEEAGVRAAELLIALLPGGRGTHVEIGIALGARVPVVLHGVDAYDRECAFYRSNGVLDRMASSVALEGVAAAVTAWHAPKLWGNERRWLPMPACFVATEVPDGP